MKSYPIIATIILFLTACSQDNVHEATDIKTIKINCDSIIKDMDYSDFVEDEIKLVFLESGENKMIGKVTSIRIISDTIYILDEISQSIFRFDINGTFISKLSAKGKAGNEYNRLIPSGFDVKNMNLYVIDKDNNRVLIYDKNNQFIKSIKLDPEKVGRFYGLTIIANEDETIDLFDSHAKISNYHFISFDQDGTIISKQLPAFDFEMSPTWNVRLEDHIAVSGNKRLSYMIAVDTIYQTKNNRIFPLFAIDFGAKKLTDAQRIDDDDDFLRNYVGIKKIALGGNSLLVYFKMNGEDYIAVCSADKGELIGVSERILTYRGALPYIEINGGFITDEYLIDVSKPVYMKGTQKLFEQYIAKYKDTSFIKNARSKFEAFDCDTGNPVLTIMKWKK